MDPITIVVTAVAAGAVAVTKEVAAQVVKDSYAALKALIVRKFGEKADVAGAVEVVEKKPDSEARQAVLREELETAEAAQDEEVVQQAQVLLDLLRQHGLTAGPSYQATVIGSGAIGQGPGAVTTGEGGVIVRGDVQGDVHIGRKEKDE